MTISERDTGAGERRRANGGRVRRIPVLASLVALAVAVIAGATGAGVAWAAPPTVQAGTNATFGTILTTGSGFALYTLTTDHNGQSTCHGSCAAAWPPLDVPGGTTPTVGPAVTGTVATTQQTNGTFQVTYDGSPVYTFVGDSAPGQVTGNGVSDFFVVTMRSTSTTTTTTGAAPTGAAPSSASGPTTTPASATASSGSSAASTAAGSTAAPTSSASAGSLAFTGAGPGLSWLFVAGLLLIMLGAATARRSSRRASA